MKTKHFILIILFIPFISLSQGEMGNWNFGFGASVSFLPDGRVVSNNDSMLNSYEGCASISDKQGSLLFYTDGETVYNRNNQIMPNGTGLEGNPSSTQSALIIPSPGSSTIYYIFTVDATVNFVRGNGLSYSIVDISEDNGNGAVTTKNINLLSDCAEKITATIKSCSDNSLWVMVFATESGDPDPRPFFNTFHSFEVTTSGVSTTAITSTFNNIALSDDRGYLKASLDGSKVACANASSGLFLYDFDVTTGRFSNQQEIVINSTNRDAYGIEFSTNNQYLYVASSNNQYTPNGQRSSLIQYDLLANDITSSQILLDERAVFRGALQLGPDGKIYRPVSVNYTTGLPYLSVINNPNQQGLAANYQHNAIELTYGLATQGLPPFITSFFNSITLLENESSDLSLCEGEPILLTAQLIAGATYSWQKDGLLLANTSNILSIPVSTEQDSGNYTVTIIRPNAVSCPVTGETNVVVAQEPNLTFLPLSQCDIQDTSTTDGFSQFNLTELQQDASFTYEFFLSPTDITNENPIADAENYVNNEPFNQTIFIRYSNVTGCSSIGETELIVYAVPEITMQEDYIFCTTDTNAQILAQPGYDTYRWYLNNNQTEVLIAEGDTLNNVEMLSSGSYILEGSNTFGTLTNPITCSTRSFFTIEISEAATIEDVLVLDNGTINSIEVITSGNGDYEYSIDNISYQDSNTILDIPSGMATIFVRDKNGCGVTEITKEIDKPLSSLEFPRFFTPNGDGINDYWNYKPLDLTNDIDIEFINIYNRYGQLIIELNPEGPGWDGTFNGQLQPTTDYWYRAITFQKKEIKGHFTLKL